LDGWDVLVGRRKGRREWCWIVVVLFYSMFFTVGLCLPFYSMFFYCLGKYVEEQAESQAFLKSAV
jgi:hypothetical protein